MSVTLPAFDCCDNVTHSDDTGEITKAMISIPVLQTAVMSLSQHFLCICSESQAAVRKMQTCTCHFQLNSAMHKIVK